MKIINQKNEECVMSCLLRDLDKLDAVRESDFSNTELKDWYRKLKRMRAEGYHSVINEDEYDKYGDFGRYIAFYYNKDTDCSYGELKSIICENLIECIQLLTRKENEKYSDYIVRIIDSNNVIALEVKLHDLENNMDITRLKCIGQKDIDRIKKYKKAYSRVWSKYIELFNKQYKIVKQ